MIAQPALREAARRAGIGLSTRDALGTVREVSDEALAAMLATLGIGTDDAIDPRAAAQNFGLDPAWIVPEENPAPLLWLRLPDTAAPLEWRIRLESGETRDGQCAIGDLSCNAGGLSALPLPASLPLGYHELELCAGAAVARTSLILAPPSCHLPPQLGPGARSWCLTTQLYGIRSARNWGMGDFRDLAALCEGAASVGAESVGINPLHALFAAEPLHFSPYSPSSRSFLNPLYIDPETAPGFSDRGRIGGLMAGERFKTTLDAAHSSALIDHGAVSHCKLEILQAAFAEFRQGTGAIAGQRDDFFAFQQEGGTALRDFATFEALHEHHYGGGGSFCWRDWPLAMQDPRSGAVRAFADVHRDRIEFFEYLQWVADRQLGAAARTGRQAGLGLGLYRDLAVGANPNGAEAWSDQQLVAPGASIGAPPDPLSRAGQNWGLAPINPLALRSRAFAPFIALLRSNMRHAGVLRIDHVMSLQRLYWIPNGMAAQEGAYVTYPLQDLLRLVALESRRHGCAVIGEDLGTVPEGFRETMQAANLLSYRVFAFERRSDGAFVPPHEYPPLSAAAAATHDVATLKGFWLGRDLEWRSRLGIYPDDAARAADAAERQRDRQLLVAALSAEGFLSPADAADFCREDRPPEYPVALERAIVAFLARTRARLMLVQLEDFAGEEEQANLPGTTDAHPNWRRRMSTPLEELLDGEGLSEMAALIRTERAKSVRA